MKFTYSWLRHVAMGLCLLMGFSAWGASVVVGGINYTTSVDRVTKKNIATVARYTVKPDTIYYEGDIVIPDSITYNGVNYTVVATAANAFLNCKDLTSLVLPESCVTIGRSCFKGCTSLRVSPVPVTATSIGTGVWNGCSAMEELTIPAAWAGPMVAEDLAGCSGLKKLIFAESETTFIMNSDAYGKVAEDKVADKSIEEIEIYRPVTARETDANNLQPFHNLTGVTTITLGGYFSTITPTMFQGCTALQNVVFADGNIVSSIGNNAFKACTSLASISLPEAVTSVEANTFNGCVLLSTVNLGSQVANIGDGAFQGCSSLKSIEWPAALTNIGTQAFQSTGLIGDVTFNEGLTRIGSQAFASTKITGFNIPASVNNIGNAAFAPITTLAALTVAEGSQSFKVENGLLTNLNGTRLLVTAHKGDIGTTLDNATIQTVDDYGLAYSPYTSINLPSLTNVGNYGFANSKVEEFELKSNVTVGYNLFNKAAIKNLVIEDGRNEIPQAMCNGCTALESVTLPTTATNIMRNAFNGCTALKNMEIPANVNYMEPGAVPATIETLRVLNVNSPVLAAGVFNESQGNVECKVANKSVDKYKAASQWCYLNIVGDATIKGKGAQFGCPTGLYFATKDGKLMYKDEEGNIIDTEFTTGAHAFNLDSYKNRIYVGVAGQNFRYQDANAQANGGDGEVFYVNNTDGIFYRVTVLNNVGYRAFEDPFSLSIGADEGKIYIADRNVGVHEMSADTVGLYGSQPFLVQNNWLSYYPNGTAGWMYGGIGCGFYKIGDTYWMGKKFNGFGIFRFRKSDFKQEASSGGTDPFKSILPYVQMTQFYVDQANGYIYFYLQKSTGAGRNDVPGVYRLPMSAVAENDARDMDTDMSQAVLLDDSPVLKEGDGDEITGVTQFTSDGEHVYWSYIATTADENSVPNSAALDLSNPLHHSGIKCVTAKPATPDEKSPVQFAVEGVEAYGLVGSTYVPDENPEILPTAITISAQDMDPSDSYTLQAGEQLQLVVTVEPEDADDTDVEWSTSDETIATVDENGLVTALTQDQIEAIIRRAPAISEEAEVYITATSVADPDVSGMVKIVVEYSTVGVTDVKVMTVKDVKYISTTGITSDEPFSGANIKVITFSDGSKKTVKVMK